ncbi:hypothetical protein ACMXYQ_07855 [Neptuniibacter sp. PT34_22]|uniref:hypothetical protein n=1 Tax=Neptuniibacter sp. PT34_22 TaxID=3398205 RepID=UPI0039F63091
MELSFEEIGKVVKVNGTQKFLIGVLIFEIILGVIAAILGGVALNLLDGYGDIHSDDSIAIKVSWCLLVLFFVVLPYTAINEVRNYYQKPKIVLNIINLILVLPIFAPMTLALLYLVYQLRNGNAQKNEIAPEA